MKLFAFITVVATFASGCKHEHSTQPPTSVSMIPQWSMFHHDARHTGNVNTPVLDVAGPQRDTIGIAWQTPVDHGIFSTPAIGPDGTAYVGTQNDTFTGTSSVYAINLDGTIKWRYLLTGQVQSSPALGEDGSIYVGGLNGMYAITPLGRLKWKNPELGMINSSPAIGNDGTVYYLTGYVGQDYFKAVDPSSGSLKWEIKGGDGSNSPSIGSDGTIYYSNNGTITAVSSGGNVKWKYRDTSYTSMTVWSIELGYDGTVYFVGFPSPYLYAVDAHGSLKWKYQIGEGWGDPCVDMENEILAVGGNRLICLESNGGVKWQSVIPAGNGTLNVPVTIDNLGDIYVAATDNFGGASLFAYNSANPLWQFGASIPNNEGKVVSSPALFGGSLFFAWEFGPPYLYRLR